MEPEENPFQGLTVRDYGEMVRRRQWVVLGIFALVTGLAFFVIRLLTPVYHAQGKLLVQSAAASASAGDLLETAAEPPALSPAEPVEVQLAVLQGNALVGLALQRAGVPRRQITQISATRQGDTSLVDIAVESPDAAAAARVANSVMAVYLEACRESSGRQTRAARQLIERSRSRAQWALEQAERALREYGRRHALPGLAAQEEGRAKERVDLDRRREENLTAMTRTAAERDEVETQLQREPEVQAVAVSDPNPRRAALEGKLAELEMNRLQLLADYREQMPEVASVNRQIGRMRQLLNAEPKELHREQRVPNPAHRELRARLMVLEIELRGLRAEQRQLSTRLAAARGSTDPARPWETELAQLTSARDAAKHRFLALDDRVQELAIRGETPRTGARVVDRADVPPAPIRPRRARLLLMAALLGAALGLAAAFLLELGNDRIATVEKAERALGLPVLASVPLMSAHQPLILSELPSRSLAAESYRELRSSIGFAAADGPLRTLVVSSADEAEGKSLTCLNLAIAMAMAGRRVTLVDADLRRPALHRLLEWEQSPGLSEVLAGTAELPEAVRRDAGVPGLQVIPSGEVPPNPAELINSTRMDELIARLAAESDVVIFDSPACLPVTDAPLLASRADAVLLVADVRAARRAALRQARDQFEWARAPIAGIVLNKVSGNQNQRFRYYRSYYDQGPRDLPPVSSNGHQNGNGAGAKKWALASRAVDPKDPPGAA